MTISIDACLEGVINLLIIAGNETVKLEGRSSDLYSYIQQTLDLAREAQAIHKLGKL